MSSKPQHIFRQKKRILSRLVKGTFNYEAKRKKLDGMYLRVIEKTKAIDDVMDNGTFTTRFNAINKLIQNNITKSMAIHN